MTENRQSMLVLLMNTLAFTVCFAVWTMNGVLATFLADERVFSWDSAQVGMLIGVPILTGALVRLPLGILTDRFGGRVVFTVLMLCTAVPLYFVSLATDYTEFLLAGLGFGMAGGSFAVGVASVSLWFKKERQGTALGIFGIGNIGSAFTSLLAPQLLQSLTRGGEYLEGWRMLPRIYAGALVVMAVAFVLLTRTKQTEQPLTLAQRLEPLRHARVWRFGLYYFVVFGGFVALSQWLIPYYVSAYTMSIATAGMLASLFSLPSGLTRAVGGWLSDRSGPRSVMYWVFGVSLVCFVLLCVPRMDIQAPGQGVLAEKAGFVTAVGNGAIDVGSKRYTLLSAQGEQNGPLQDDAILVWPTFTFAQVPIVSAGDSVLKRQLIARGITHIYFQANVWIFTGLVFIVALAMGIGMGAVYKFIPEYYPAQVGVVGGIVGVLGGLGGFAYPIMFGLLLSQTGIWTTVWMQMFVVTAAAFLWLHLTVRKIMQAKASNLIRRLEGGVSSQSSGQ